MSPEYLERQLAVYQRLLLAVLGAAVTLLATAVADLPNNPTLYFPGWYAVWFILQLASLLPGAVLLGGGAFRSLPLAQRLDTGFGFLALTWIVLAALGLKLAGTLAVPWLALGAVLGGLALALGLAYALLRRRHVSQPEAMFP